MKRIVSSAVNQVSDDKKASFNCGGACQVGRGALTCIGVNLRLCMTSAQSLDPPKSPFKRGTLINLWFPPWNKKRSILGSPPWNKKRSILGSPPWNKKRSNIWSPHGTKSEASLGLPLLKGDGRGI